MRWNRLLTVKVITISFDETIFNCSSQKNNIAIAEALETVGTILPELSRNYDDENYGTDDYDDKIRKSCKVVGEIAQKYGSPRGIILTN
ncbi:hypothetical protein [Nostoc sp.]|uniref:hypothetical protein n=1 Tax=Nostoc sp. TaxID=1180 RepID=UPI002FEFC8D3